MIGDSRRLASRRIHRMKDHLEPVSETTRSAGIAPQLRDPDPHAPPRLLIMADIDSELQLDIAYIKPQLIVWSRRHRLSELRADPADRLRQRRPRTFRRNLHSSTHASPHGRNPEDCPIRS